MKTDVSPTKTVEHVGAQFVPASVLVTIWSNSLIVSTIGFVDVCPFDSTCPIAHVSRLTTSNPFAIGGALNCVVLPDDICEFAVG